MAAEQPQEQKKSWKDLLFELTVLDVVKAVHHHHKDLVTLSPSISLTQAIDTLSSNKVLSAPLVDQEQHSFLGMVDALDIMTFIVSHWRKASQSYEVGSFPPSDFFNTPISQVANYSHTNYPRVIPDVAKLEDLIQIFIEPSPPGAVHRVVVLHGVGKILTILSQSDLVRFLAKHIEDMKADATIEELGLSHIVISAQADAPASKVVELMTDHRISAVALTDSKGHLVGNLSATDFRGMKPTSVDYFLMTAAAFVDKGISPQKPIKCHLDTTLRELFVLLVKNRVHRVYIVTKEDYLIGVVTLTDLIRHVSQLAK